MRSQLLVLVRIEIIHPDWRRFILQLAQFQIVALSEFRLSLVLFSLCTRHKEVLSISAVDFIKRHLNMREPPLLHDLAISLLYHKFRCCTDAVLSKKWSIWGYFGRRRVVLRAVVVVERRRDKATLRHHFRLVIFLQQVVFHLTPNQTRFLIPTLMGRQCLSDPTRRCLLLKHCLMRLLLRRLLLHFKFDH